MSVMQILFSFQGRIRRTHYWLGSIGMGLAGSVAVFVVLMITGMGALMASAGQSPEAGSQATAAAAATGGGMAILGVVLLFPIFGVLMWSALALQAKRWHDRGKSGWMFLVTFIPLVGALWTLVECGFLDGTPGENKFGPSPKGVTSPAVAPA